MLVDIFSRTMRTTYLGVSVRDVSALLCGPKGVDDITQTTQTLVDVLCFLQACAFNLGVFQPLGSGKIDEIECAFAPLTRNLVGTYELQDKH